MAYREDMVNLELAASSLYKPLIIPCGLLADSSQIDDLLGGMAGSPWLATGPMLPWPPIDLCI